MVNLKGRTALVTGASSGLGEAFARRLAAAGADLVITARRAERLEALAAELRAKHGVAVEVLPMDLARAGAATELHARTEGAGRAVDVLINNAGFGVQQRFVDIPWERTAEQLQLNLLSVAELTWRFARAMLARGRGYVLNVASIGAYSPSPDYAAYSASKVFVRDLSEAVAFELAGTGVRVCAVCPGLTRTEFHVVAGHELSPLVRATMMSADRCAAIALSALFRGRRNVITGLVNKLAMFFTRFLPRRVLAWSAALAAGRRGERPALPAPPSGG
jgi:short-subunit dehydrogenase